MFAESLNNCVLLLLLLCYIGCQVIYLFIQFYDRLKLSEEKVQRDRKQLHERSREETSEKLEKQLAGQFRLSNSAPDGDPLQGT